jgi:hypothetical protein
MRIRFLTVIVAISSVFGVQQAVAKSSSTTDVASKKKHKNKKPKLAAAPVGHNDARLAV